MYLCLYLCFCARLFSKLLDLTLLMSDVCSQTTKIRLFLNLAQLGQKLTHIYFKIVLKQKGQIYELYKKRIIIKFR